MIYFTLVVGCISIAIFFHVVFGAFDEIAKCDKVIAESKEMRKRIYPNSKETCDE